jgi:hypothetical protein
MDQTARGIFEISAWDEKTVVELGPGAKLSEARVTQKFSGDLVGDGTVTWLMCYANEKYARFVGMQRFLGAIGDRTGGFVMETVGEFDGTLAKGNWSIVPGSGTGALAGIAGEGSFEAPHGPKATYSIEYAFEKAVTKPSR